MTNIIATIVSIAAAITAIASTNDIYFIESSMSIGSMMNISVSDSLTISCGDGEIGISFKTGKVSLPKDQKLDAVALDFWKAVEKCFPKEFPLGGSITTSSLETNKTESFPKHMVSDPCPEKKGEGSWGISCGVFHFHYENDVNPKTKTVTTKVDLIKRLQFEWEGQARVVESRELISEKTQTFIAREGWEKEGGEQDVMPNMIIGITNVQYFGTLTNYFLMETNHGILWVPSPNK